ncbi:AAA family ATPase [Thalassobacillus pellis]|uniref:AAA family ATPase n=1 Tax=Thalassobacillus pellis TaxID=748008 RepID=UPI0019604283|nr:MoxR-like ATPase [Thalassobacillus pellis]
MKEAESKQEEPKRRHKAFPTLLATAQAGVPVMLVGPAGSGKSTAGRQVAEEMGLSFRSESCNPMMTKWDLFGFVGPNGNYVPGVIREAFENGGVVLLDEMDASNPAVLVSINLLASVEAGETVTFPDGKNVPRHENFVLIAGANTFGDGASAEYVGREQLDAATLDRFAMVEWSYDEALERKAAGEDQAAWVVCVQDVRAAAERASVSLLVTPRASINGAKLIRKGMDRETVANLVLWKGVSTDEKRSILAQM